MTATAKHRGHPVWFDEKSRQWRYQDDGRPVLFGTGVPCRHCREIDKAVCVTVPADLSHTGQERQKVTGIDACIAPIVEALEARGIKMRHSCCGHGEADGEIQLQDGRVLVIKRRASSQPVPAGVTYLPQCRSSPGGGTASTS